MWKAFANHFGGRFKLKMPKIRHLCNLKSAKIAKNVEKYFQSQFWRIRHAQNILKSTPNERGDQTHLHPIYFPIF